MARKKFEFTFEKPFTTLATKKIFQATKKLENLHSVCTSFWFVKLADLRGFHQVDGNERLALLGSNIPTTTTRWHPWLHVAASYPQYLRPRWPHGELLSLEVLALEVLSVINLRCLKRRDWKLGSELHMSTGLPWVIMGYLSISHLLKGWFTPKKKNLSTCAAWFSLKKYWGKPKSHADKQLRREDENSVLGWPIFGGYVNVREFDVGGNVNCKLNSDFGDRKQLGNL